jgi:hypothetical protein
VEDLALKRLRRLLVVFLEGSIAHIIALIVVNVFLLCLMIGAGLELLPLFMDFETAQNILIFPIVILFPFVLLPMLIIGERIWMFFGFYRLIGARDFFFRDHIVRMLQPGER